MDSQQSLASKTVKHRQGSSSQNFTVKTLNSFTAASSCRV